MSDQNWSEIWSEEHKEVMALSEAQQFEYKNKIKQNFEHKDALRLACHVGVFNWRISLQRDCVYYCQLVRGRFKVMLKIMNDPRHNFEIGRGHFTDTLNGYNESSIAILWPKWEAYHAYTQDKTQPYARREPHWFIPLRSIEEREDLYVRAGKSEEDARSLAMASMQEDMTRARSDGTYIAYAVSCEIVETTTNVVLSKVTEEGIEVSSASASADLAGTFDPYAIENFHNASLNAGETLHMLSGISEHDVKELTYGI